MIGQDALYWIWLASKCGVASRHFDKLIQKYPNPFDIYRLESDEIAHLDGLADTQKDKLCEKDLDAAYDVMKYCKSNKIDIITYVDRRYPERLKNLQDPPILLYCMGHFPNFNESLCVAMVGTRSMNEYGKQSAYKIAYELSAAGALVVSGMALGIDGVAAVGALSAGGKTVAVLGCGIDTVYPKHHKKLMEQIAKHGAVITEYLPKEEPHGYNFPKRNRIISGLCQGTVVVQASMDSGALITARRAIDQGREVFAIPGKINDEESEGPNSLIREGAYAVLTADDILKNYEFLYSDLIDKKNLSRARKNMPLADPALEKYGLFYALGGEDREEKVFSVKGLRKRKADKSQTQTSERDVPQEAPKDEPKTDATEQSNAALIESLDANTRKILESLPLDKAISVDKVIVEGIGVTETITALTMLEIEGLVTSLPGGLFMRK